MTAKIPGASPDAKRAREVFLRRLYPIATVFLILAFVYFLYQIVRPMILNISAGGVESLPVSIRAGSGADYSQDPHRPVIPAINENILNQIIADFPATGSPEDRIATFQVFLLTPVPTMTPDRHPAASLTPGLSLPTTPALITVSPAATGFTLPVPTATLLSATASPTNLFLITPTATLAATYPSAATRTPTHPYATTPAPTFFMTATPIHTISYTSTPQLTSTMLSTVKPTSTPQPANTPLPSNTPQPPNTPLPSNTPQPPNTPKPTNTHRPTSKN